MDNVESTLGKIRSDLLGRVDTHEHIVIVGDHFCNLYPDFKHDDIDKLSTELLQWKNAGGGAIIDSSPICAGRNIKKLEKISTQIDLPIIAVTGFHKSEYYPSDHWINKLTEKEMTNILRHECFIGIQNYDQNGKKQFQSSTKAGVIKLGLDSRGLTPFIQKVLNASLELIQKENIPLMLHCEPGVPFESFINWFEKNHVNFKAILFCHMDKIPDFSFHKILTSLGFFIEYDSMVRKKPPLREFAEILNRIFSLNLENKILFGGDLARRSYWKCYDGDPGLVFLMADLKNELFQFGFNEKDFDKIWIENPRSWFEGK